MFFESGRLFKCFCKKMPNYTQPKGRGFNVRHFKLQRAFISTLKCGAFGSIEVINIVFPTLETFKYTDGPFLGGVFTNA